MRTPLAPAFNSFSITSLSLEAGPIVINIFAFLKVRPMTAFRFKTWELFRYC